MPNANRKLLVSVHCYAGDAHQVRLLLPYYEHHGAPVVIISPEDSKVTGIGPHHCWFAGRRGYTGQVSWDRQIAQMEMLLATDFDWFLMQDSDSLCLTPELPEYLFSQSDVVWGCVVNDFRRPGETWTDGNGTVHGPFPKDFHRGFSLRANQPGYFLHRNALARTVRSGRGLMACAVCPFIDWLMIEAPERASLDVRGFHRFASCETSTANGRAVMAQNVAERGAVFIHAIKDQLALDTVLAARQRWLAAHPWE